MRGHPGHEIVFVVTLFAAVAAGFLLTSPIPQDPAYHRFVDGRTLFGLQNFWNVASNLPFLIVGIWGLIYVRRHGDEVCPPGLQGAYVVFFAGVSLTAAGSGYYHFDPSNEPLVWDRLPMTISFAGLFSIIIGEFVSLHAARRILVPLLVAGIVSVAYWAMTEAAGNGDLRPYAAVQFLPMLLIPIVLLIYAPSIGAKKYFWFMLLFYGLAKVFEFFDARVFAAGELLSGHTLKHLFAAGSPVTMLFALSTRRS